MSRNEPVPVSVRLQRGAATPLAVQLAGQLRGRIQAGGLAAADRLPSSRALARELGVARGVVEQAFDQLTAEGWLTARHGSGTFVTDDVRTAGPRRRPPAVRPRGAGADRPDVIRLDTGTPWVDPRHRAGWRRAWREVAQATMPQEYPDPAGLPALRAVIADHVNTHRGLACTADEVLVTAGTTHGLAMLLDVVAPGAVAVEDPGYRAAVEVSRHAGREVVDVPVDSDGFDVAALAADPRRDVRALYVTPAHQHPLGITMSAPRRVALLAEAARRDALVVEDDYDSEFRYDVAPLPALAQLGLDRVAYLGTAAKTVAPGLRIGWLVTTADRAAEIAARRAARHDHPSWPVQRALLSMFEDGHVTRSVRSARRVYAERGDLVRGVLEPHGSLTGDLAGMYLTLALEPALAASVVRLAAADGVEVPSLADYCRGARRAGIVVGFGGPTDEQFGHVLRVLGRALARATA